jgi:Domain of unknown function (DUF4258)
MALRPVYTRHALEKFAERRIALDWIERTLSDPDLTEPDSTQPGAVRAFKAIEEHTSMKARIAGSSPCFSTEGEDDEDDL